MLSQTHIHDQQIGLISVSLKNPSSLKIKSQNQKFIPSQKSSQPKSRIVTMPKILNEQGGEIC